MAAELNTGFSKDLNKLINFPPEGIFSTVLTKTEGSSCTLMCLSKESSIDTHTSTKAGVIYVIKGKGKFKLFDEEIFMQNGTFIFMPKNSPHSLNAIEDLAIILLLTN